MFVRHFTFTHSEIVKHNRFSKCFSEHKVSVLKNRDHFHLWTRCHNHLLLLLCLFVTSLLPIVKSCEIVKHNRFSKCFSEHKNSGLKNRNRFHIWTRRHNHFLLLLCLFVTSLLPIVKSYEIVKHNRFSKCFSEHKVSGLKNRDFFYLWTRHHNHFLLLLCLFVTSLLPIVKA